MPTIVLYECKRLRARLSLASCEANRAKPDNAMMLSDELSYAIRPYPCRACTDWQAWNNTNTEEVTVPKSESTTPVCTECGKEKTIVARGMCRGCYDRNYVRRNASQKTASAPEVVPAPDLVPVPAVTPVPAPAEPQIAEPQPAPAPTGSKRRVYLACPYSGASADVEKVRFLSATNVARELIRQGNIVFSPLTHGHTLCDGASLPGDFDFWREMCLSHIEHWATDVYVLMVPGWEASVGVTAEVEAAKARAIPVTHILPLPLTLQA